MLASPGVGNPCPLEAPVREAEGNRVPGSLLRSIYNDCDGRPLLEKALAGVRSERERFEIGDMVYWVGGRQ